MYAANALHVLMTGRLPGVETAPTMTEDKQAAEELQYAGELMLVQFFSLIRTTLKPKDEER